VVRNNNWPILPRLDRYSSVQQDRYVAELLGPVEITSRLSVRVLHTEYHVSLRTAQVRARVCVITVIPELCFQICRHCR
jgi:hypothetical protein